MVGHVGQRVILKARGAPGARCTREARRRVGVGVNGRHDPPTQPAAARGALSYGVERTKNPGVRNPKATTGWILVVRTTVQNGDSARRDGRADPRHDSPTGPDDVIPPGF
jgi:hypothetical protein